MYKEVNNYQVYDLSFSFPIEKWLNEIKIDCTNNAVLYPDSDVGQWVACVWSWTTITTFDIQNNSTNLILTDYINSADVSFWTIEINATGSVVIPNSIFKTEENLQEFYLWEWIVIIILLLFIFFQKTFRNLKY